MAKTRRPEAKTIRTFIGWDSREELTYQACVNSIRTFTQDVDIEPLKQPYLRTLGLYQRPADTAATEFSLTRFLTPCLAGYEGWALFCDCDFVFTRDLRELFALADDRYSVMVVKHPESLWTNKHGIDESVSKMDSKSNTYYPRKWWSALMLINCDHQDIDNLTPFDINSVSPSYLHRFEWTKDENIGELPAEWHWLDGYSEKTDKLPAGIHYTRGTPELGIEDTVYHDLWWKAVSCELDGVSNGALFG